MHGLVSDCAAATSSGSNSLTRLEKLAHTDSLTGLHNRRAWQETLGRSIASARRHETPLAVAILDLDDFKTINDVHGHLAGDRRRELAGTWQALTRADDVLARLGGDEFGLVMPGTPAEEAIEVIERLRTAVPPGHSCSGGVAAFAGEPSPEALPARADTALYAAKAAGRNRVVTSDDARFELPRHFEARGPRGLRPGPPRCVDVFALRPAPTAGCRQSFGGLGARRVSLRV